MAAYVTLSTFSGETTETETPGRRARQRTVEAISQASPLVVVLNNGIDKVNGTL